MMLSTAFLPQARVGSMSERRKATEEGDGNPAKRPALKVEPLKEDFNLETSVDERFQRVHAKLASKRAADRHRIEQIRAMKLQTRRSLLSFRVSFHYPFGCCDIKLELV